MSVVVTAIFRPVDGRKDELAAAMRAGIEATHAEQGCQLYAIHDAEDGTITMIERWATEADLEAHARGEAVARMVADIDGLLAEPVVVTRMRPIPMGENGKGTL